jgi:hypothetical protein
MFKPTDSTKTNWIATVAIFILFSIYYFIIVIDYPPNDIRLSDIRAHAMIAYSYAVNHDKLSPNFLYDYLVALVSGFSNRLPVYYISSIILLSIAVTAKFAVTRFYLLKYSALKGNAILSIALPIAMLFVFPLPGLDFFHPNNLYLSLGYSRIFYLGQLTPNVWHNPTVIFVMPFAVLLFFKSYELLFVNSTQHDQRILIHIALLIAINALIKPSFLFTLLPSVFIFYFYNRIISENTHTKFIQLSPYLLGMLLIAAEYYAIYKLNYTSSAANTIVDAEGKSSIVLAPFKVWKLYSSNLVIAVITSLFFPLIYFLVSKGGLFKDKIVQFAIMNFLIALSIWILFAEAGARESHANLLWQVVIAAYLLFFSLLLHFIKEVELNKLNQTSRRIIGGAFLLHFIWGVVYWLNIIKYGYY